MSASQFVDYCREEPLNRGGNVSPFGSRGEKQSCGAGYVGEELLDLDYHEDKDADVDFKVDLKDTGAARTIQGMNTHQMVVTLYGTITDKKSVDNPLFKEIIESQKKFAERTVRWDLDTYVNRRMAYNHYFGRKPAANKA